MLVRWSQSWSWQPEVSGRVAAARLEHVDLEVRPPEVIMEVVLTVEIEPATTVCGVPGQANAAAACPASATAREDGADIAAGGADGEGVARESAETQDGAEFSAGGGREVDGAEQEVDADYSAGSEKGDMTEAPQGGGHQPTVEVFGGGEPRSMELLLWEGVSEVRELYGTSAKRSIINVGGMNIVVGEP